MFYRHVWLGLAMVCAASASSSLTLGGVRGAVVVGQPLNIGIQMTVDGTEDARSLCIAAEVFSGDTRVDPSRVTVSMDPPDANGNTVARIRSNAPVEEAFVAVNLRVGCTQVSTRRYVVLTDIVTETVSESAAQVAAPTAAAPVAQSAPAPSSTGPVASAAPSNGAVAAAAAPAQPVPVSRPSRVVPRQAAPKAQASGVVKPAEPKPARAVAQPRLKLDSVQPLAAIDQNLRKSTELATTPAATPEKSAEAAALWRTLNAQPQDILREAQRLQGLEAEFKAFREQTNKNQAELAAQLQIAAQQRDQSMYVYILSGLLALAMVLVAGLWWSLRRRAEAQREWWEERGQAGERARPQENGAASAADVSAAEQGIPANGAASQPGQVPGATSGEGANESAGAKQAKSMAESRSADGRFQDKAEHYEELFDVQQQADFFLSLGQTDQAIALLNNHIRSSEETSPLAYLELLRIYHSTGRTQEYEALRTSFMRVFNANVPEFQSYGEETRDLESYRGIVPSIQAAWGTPKGEKMLDEMMFRRPGSKWDHAFELTAYTELSMLQGIAKEVSATPAGERNPVSVFGVLPLGNRVGGAAAGHRPANALGLDLDLGGQEPAAAAPAYLERPEPKFSEELPTRPGLLSSSGTTPKRKAAGDLPDNLVNFEPEPTPLPKLDPGKS